jgi:flagellar basal-body rod protein FlgB
MLSDLSILRVAGALGRYAAHRHSLIAQNVANADTPGYRAVDLEPFETALRHARSPLDATATARTVTTSSPGTASPNRNTVSLEDQMLRAAEAMRASEIAATIFEKTTAMLRAAAARPR